MNIHNDLSVEWADIPGEGLVRVFPTQSYRQGIAIVGKIGETAELLNYYPSIELNSEKVIVTIPTDSDGKDHQLAHAIDTRYSEHF